jgi:hypothetical protein
MFMLILNDFYLNKFYKNWLKSWAFDSPQQLLVVRSSKKLKQTGAKAMACNLLLPCGHADDQSAISPCHVLGRLPVVSSIGWLKSPRSPLLRAHSAPCMPLNHERSTHLGAEPCYLSATVYDAEQRIQKWD